MEEITKVIAILCLIVIVMLILMILGMTYSTRNEKDPGEKEE